MDEIENVDEGEGGISAVEGKPTQASFAADNPPPQPPYSQPYSQPYPQPPMYAQPAAPPQMLLSSVFWKALWFLVLVGAILVLVGQILLDVADYSDEGMIKAGKVLRTISAFLIGTPMVITGIYYDETRDMVRFGLILAGTILLAFAFY